VTEKDAISPQPGQYVKANGLSMYYNEYGSGKPLILLHGGTVSSSMWQPHISSFARNFRVITPDSRAHGRTNNPSGELSYHLMADDVVAFIQALDLPKPLLFGYSDGGHVALELGMRYPHLTEAIVVGAAWYRFSETYITWLKTAGFEKKGTVNFEHLQLKEPDWVSLLETEHVRVGDPNYWKTLLKQISTMWWTPLDYAAKDFEKITEPMLILIGDRDGVVELEQAVQMYQLIPTAELAVLPNATHMSSITDLSINIVLNFLLRHSTPAGHQ
jgi:pimeloyl-ACP methyl ester carboxylesterase